MAQQNKDKPLISNYPPLAQWLEKHRAHCLWQAVIPPRAPNAPSDWEPSAYLEGWRIGTKLFILKVYANQGGWDLFTALNDQTITKTLEDAEHRLGIKKT